LRERRSGLLAEGARFERPDEEWGQTARPLPLLGRLPRHFVHSVLRQLARRQEARVGSMPPVDVVEQLQRQLARLQEAARRSVAEFQSARWRTRA
jgi:hypothetical protein